MINEIQNKYMLAALREAKKAAAEDEVPIGAVAVKDGVIIARAHNKKEKLKDATAHAEMLLIRKVLRKTGLKYMDGVTVYVTLEPCPMCAGALLNARVSELVYGAYDQKAGACGTLLTLLTDKRFNHTARVTGGVCEQECKELLSSFFKTKR